MNKQKKNKRNSIRRWEVFLIFPICFFLLGCPPPETVLKPQPAENYELVSSRHDADTVQIAASGMILKISGNWRPEGLIGFHVDVENNSAVPQRFDLYKIVVADETGRTARLNGISEIVENKIGNGNQVNENRAKWVSLPENKGLTFQPQQNRSVSINFQFPTADGFKLDSGKKLKLMIPALSQTGDEIEIWFECVYD